MIAGFKKNNVANDKQNVPAILVNDALIFTVNDVIKWMATHYWI